MNFSPEILIPVFSLLAIFGIVAGINKLFPVQTLLDESRVRRHIERVFPGSGVSWVLVGVDGRSAIAGLEGSSGLLIARSMGLRVTIRNIADEALKWKAGTDGRSLELHSGDFTMPSITLKLDDPQRLEQLQEWLEKEGIAHA